MKHDVSPPPRSVPLATTKDPRRTCRACGAESARLVCARCGAASWAPVGTAVRPSRFVAEEPPVMPWPWSELADWPAGGFGLLSGDKGSGKSTLALLLGRVWPLTWITSEQRIPDVAAYCARLGVPTPRIAAVTGTAQAERAILATGAGLAVLDSVTETGHHDAQLELARQGLRWVEEEDHRRLLFVAQLNAEGGVAGRNALAHLVKQTTHVEKDGGFRRFDVGKNRYGPLRSALFKLGAGGPEPADLPYAYSVEGEPGRYRLHPYPLPGAKWAGVLDHQAERGILSAPCASAGLVCGYYPGRVLLPDDVEERRAFAAAHGLAWTDEVTTEE